MKMLFIAILACSLLSSCAMSNNPVTYSEQDYREFVQTEMANSLNYSTKRVGWNTMLHVPNITAYEDKFVVRPNNDTLYSFGNIDIEEGYAVLQLPETDRYLSVLLYDFEHYILEGGVLVNETRPIVLVKKGNPVPNIDGVIFESENGVVIPIIRLLVRGVEDVAVANRIQQQITLSKVGKKVHSGFLSPALGSKKFEEMRTFFRERTGTTS